MKTLKQADNVHCQIGKSIHKLMRRQEITAITEKTSTASLNSLNTNRFSARKVVTSLRKPALPVWLIHYKPIQLPSLIVQM